MSNSNCYPKIKADKNYIKTRLTRAKTSSGVHFISTFSFLKKSQRNMFNLTHSHVPFVTSSVLTTKSVFDNQSMQLIEIVQIMSTTGWIRSNELGYTHAQNKIKEFSLGKRNKKKTKNRKMKTKVTGLSTSKSESSLNCAHALVLALFLCSFLVRRAREAYELGNAR